MHQHLKSSFTLCIMVFFKYSMGIDVKLVTSSSRTCQFEQFVDCVIHTQQLVVYFTRQIQTHHIQYNHQALHYVAYEVSNCCLFSRQFYVDLVIPQVIHNKPFNPQVFSLNLIHSSKLREFLVIFCGFFDFWMF